jgi:hypothetical protein
MSRLLEPGRKRPRHRGVFTERLDRRSSRAGRAAVTPAARMASKSAAVAPAAPAAPWLKRCAPCHASRKDGEEGQRDARHVAVFGLSHPPPARFAVAISAKGAPRLPRLLRNEVSREYFSRAPGPHLHRATARTQSQARRASDDAWSPTERLRPRSRP